MLGRALDNPYLNRLLERIRQSTGNTVIYRRRTIRRVLRTLQAGRGSQLTPVTAPIALVPIQAGGAGLSFGRVVPADARFEAYRAHLDKVTEDGRVYRAGPEPVAITPEPAIPLQHSPRPTTRLTGKPWRLTVPGPWRLLDHAAAK